ncbi:MAG: recombinase family protein [Defluviitaleaceae bacterium]|nr:recombinase family protein [Defluviitaleaceae bacterium]
MMNIRQPAKNTVKPENKGLTALYCRLSKDDEMRSGDSISIKHQREILEKYAKANGFTNIACFVDDGVSGTTFERDDWQRLITEVKAGNVSVLCVKDMSRLGRDHVQVGMYMEMFRQAGIRFIAVENNIDSIQPETLEFAPFIAIMAEWYARDTSRKIKNVLHAKGNSGKHLTNSALYGYRKSPNDNNVWLLDEEAASVVRRIFQMTIDGKGPYQIARTFTDEKILRPSAYIALRDGHEISNLEDKYSWGGKTVSNLLDMPEFMGHTVNFRTYKDSYKDKKAKRRPKEEWVVFKNTQEPVVDEQTWETAQKCRVVKRRATSSGEPNPLTGLVYCGDCGGRMYNHRGSLAYKYDSQDSYCCNQSAKYPRKCTMHYIKTSSLRTLVLDTIQTVSGFVKENEDEFIRLVREASELQSGEAAKIQKKQLAQHQRRCAELDTLIKRLFEDSVKSGLSAKRVEILATEYEQEQEELELQIAELQEELDRFDDDSDKTDKFIAIVRKYTDITELTATILNEYVNKIVVFEADKSSGRREQRVDIYLNFIGKFSPPGSEEEQEPFDPDEHRKAQFRAYYHRNKEKILAEKAEKRAAEKAAKLAELPTKTPEELAVEEAERKERKRTYQREYQREWQRKKREEKNSETTPKPDPKERPA